MGASVRFSSRCAGWTAGALVTLPAGALGRAGPSGMGREVVTWCARGAEDAGRGGLVV